MNLTGFSPADVGLLVHPASLAPDGEIALVLRVDRRQVRIGDRPR